jgi:hypothetical protein
MLKIILPDFLYKKEGYDFLYQSKQKNKIINPIKGTSGWKISTLSGDSGGFVRFVSKLGAIDVPFSNAFEILTQNNIIDGVLQGTFLVCKNPDAYNRSTLILVDVDSEIAQSIQCNNIASKHAHIGKIEMDEYITLTNGQKWQKFKHHSIIHKEEEKKVMFFIHEEILWCQLEEDLKPIYWKNRKTKPNQIIKKDKGTTIPSEVVKNKNFYMTKDYSRNYFISEYRSYGNKIISSYELDKWYCLEELYNSNQ